LRRWESGTAVPSAQAEAILLERCQADGLFRAYAHGRLQHLEAMPRLLSDVLAEARHHAASGRSTAIVGDSEPVPHNLPAHLPQLIGREGEHALLLQRLLDPRTGLLTLTGPGGVGKTRLALQLAQDALAAFAAGVWLVELAPLADPELVVAVTAATLGILERGNRPLRDLLIERIHSRTTLLVLDNCEHIVGACAKLAGELLAACPSLRILATSREPLRITAETIWRVPPLATPGAQLPTVLDELLAVPAVRLFVERAQAVDPTFKLTRHNAPSVAHICARLDGLPLAIELAASLARVLSVEQIAPRLDDAFNLLVGGSRTAPSRQRTLAATLDWSLELLSDPERALFRRLAVFAGGFDLEAAEAVSATTRDALRSDFLALLTSLVDKSLVQVDAGTASARYRYLEPVRQHAAAQLAASADVEAVQRQHALHYLALAERAAPELLGPQQREWFKRLELDHDNLRAALRWSQPSSETDDRAQLHLRLAVALGRFWLARCYFTEGARLMDGTLAIPAPPAVRARQLLWAGLLARYHDDFPRSLKLLDESRQLSDQAGDAATAAWACGPMGAMYMDAGDFERAEDLLQAAVTYSQTAGQPRILGVALASLAESGRARGDYAAAVALYEQALVQASLAGDPHLEAGVLGSLAQAIALQGDYRGAGQVLVRSLDLAEDLGEVRRCAMNVEALGSVLVLSGRTADGARLLGAIEAWREHSAARRERPDQVLHARGVAAARARLDPATFESAWSEGRLMPLARALEDARVLIGRVRGRHAADGAPTAVAHSAGTRLTPREFEVVELLALELSNREIAQRLTIGEGTARIHVARVLAKLGLRSRWQVAAWARAEHLLSET
jgi:non-specific serine/threonine protein kinase